MFLLDTNVLSEAMKPLPDVHVLNWLRARSGPELSISALTLGEIEKGVASLAPSARREGLESWVRVELPRRFLGRIHPVDVEIARSWGRLAGEGKKEGRPLPVIDGLLLATAQVLRLTLVTRNEADCAGRGVAVLNPWTPPRPGGR